MTPLPAPTTRTGLLVRGHEPRHVHMEPYPANCRRAGSRSRIGRSSRRKALERKRRTASKSGT